MAFDAHKNLAIAVVAVAPSPPGTGLTLTVAAGHGVRYPVAPFDVTIWLATEYPNPANAEVARCTALAGDVLTLVRAQGGTTARLVQPGDLIAESITAQYLQSLEAAIGTTPSPPTLHAPTHEVGGSDPITGALSLTTLTTSGTIAAGGDIVMVPDKIIRQSTTAGADTNLIQIFGGGGPTDLSRGGAINVWGKNGVNPGGFDLYGATGTGAINFAPGGTSVGRMWPSGGFSWGDTQVGADPGADNVRVEGAVTATSVNVVNPGGNLTVASNIIIGPSLSGAVRQGTADGADTGSIFFCGGGDEFVTRGSLVQMCGNEHGSFPGQLRLLAGDVAAGGITFWTGSNFQRGQIFASGGFGWGAGATDPGTNNLNVVGFINADAGKRVLSVTGGFPGGTTDFLRADGVFAAPPGGGGGAPALHAATHTPGNTDPIPNVGWTNVANTWTLAQTHSGTADLIFSGTGRVRWGSLVGDPQLKRNAATLELRTGTDSAFATFKALLVASDITTGTLPLARIQFTGSPRLLGRGTAAAGGSEEITLGTGLTMTGTVLSASGGGAPAAHHATHEVGGSDQITGAMSFSTLATSGAAQIGGNLAVTGALITGNILGLTTSASIGTVSPTPGTGQLGVQNDIKFGEQALAQHWIATSTLDGADTATLIITPSGNEGLANIGDRGPSIQMRGNDAPLLGGYIQILSGNKPSPNGFIAISAASYVQLAAIDKVEFLTNSTVRGTMHPSGGFSWGNTTDPGAGNLSVSGDLIFDKAAAAYRQVRFNTADGADTGILYINGGGAVADANRGGWVSVGGNESVNPGTVQLVAGDVTTASINFFTGATVVRGMMHRSGGFSWGSTVDPGAGHFRLSGSLVFDGPNRAVMHSTPDGADTQSITINGGGGLASARGADLTLFGNESGAPGMVYLSAGNTPTGAINFRTGADFIRGTMHPSGGFSWGGTADPGAGAMLFGAVYAAGQAFAKIAPSTLEIGAPTNNATNIMLFYTPSGIAGNIATVGATTVYGTTSDARLKTDRGRLTDTSVLRDTIVHTFDWKNDGSAGRGVFAQEARDVAPFAVSVGTDELNEQGHLAKPWGVDYSKYVPDLIVGWQRHEAELAELKAELALLRGSH